MAAKSDYYDILGVTKHSSADEIKKAYRKQALEWHPDRHQGSDKEAAEKRFKEINEAYQVLSDQNKRAAYDQYGHQAFAPGGGFSGGGFPGAGGGQAGKWGPFTYTYSTQGGDNPFSSFDFGDPFDIFEQFFGGGSPFRQAKRKPRYSITIDFMEAVNGVEKTVEVNGKKHNLKIPAGINEGSRIEFDDFTLSVDIRQDKIFERDGDDVYITVSIPYSLAVLGGEIEVPTLDDGIKIRVRSGTNHGTMMRLKGRGVKHVRGNYRGDEYIRINVAIPEKVSRDQKEVIEDLKKLGL